MFPSLGVDVYLTENRGELQKVLPVDLLLADRGFTVKESMENFN